MAPCRTDRRSPLPSSWQLRYAKPQEMTRPFSDAVEHLPDITRAIAGARRLRVVNATPGKPAGERVIWPRQLEFWGQVWTCGGWCEARQDFRVFRLDRMTDVALLDRRPDVPGRDLAAYLAAVQPRPGPGDDGVTCSAFQPLASRR